MSDSGAPFLIVGLGNPGRKYRGNRHNIGFMVIDELIQHVGASFFTTQGEALVTDVRYQGQKLIFAKPQTYMNHSGRSVRSLANFYKIPLDQVMVIYDDVDLPFETIRLRPSGGSGGQKGMKSIIAQLGSRDFPRARIGIGRPPGRMSVSAYVLQDFSPQEKEALPFLLDQARQAILTWVSEGIEQAMTEFNA